MAQSHTPVGDGHTPPEMQDVNITLDIINAEEVRLTLVGHPTGVEALLTPRVREALTAAIAERIAEVGGQR